MLPGHSFECKFKTFWAQNWPYDKPDTIPLTVVRRKTKQPRSYNIQYISNIKDYISVTQSLESHQGQNPFFSFFFFFAIHIWCLE